MRTFQLVPLLASLLAVRLGSAAPTGLKCIVATTNGGNDTDNALSAFSRCQNGGAVIFSANSSYNIYSNLNINNLKDVDIVIDGDVVFPYNDGKWDLKRGAYFSIQGFNVHISGHGSMSSDGQRWWDNRTELSLVYSLLFSISVDGGSLKDVTFKNSAAANVGMRDTSNFKVSRITVEAISNSTHPPRNTDGIDMSRGSNVSIHDVTILNGDDCIAIGGGASNVDIRRVHCGNICHGISIGSIGAPGSPNGTLSTVSNVHFEDVSLHGCTNAIRLKSWATPVVGAIRNVTYSNITLEEVGFAITIDQNYGVGSCPTCVKSHSMIQIEDFKVSGVRGTTTQGVTLDFSAAMPATDVVFENIDIAGPTLSSNAKIHCGNTVGSNFTGIACP
ncbi:pectin lyase fold/virulence factor [Blyttiomyces helicus]|uniref:Pectin lyase fold/virulence factor n=1 Tax=Blyttiomyces helicus TaxID=388810 RepID=A0A4P9WI58_9FUNG|nr:pectin lyase fold/virulence factor [Blyttiomyces helicus]|eukprot:RKO92444.1 pectin lyase fold/virulence factor [Blyttiomyces helicus]